MPAQPTLFVDPVLCIAAPWKGAGLDRQLPMPFVSQQQDYILSPYFDWLSFYFNNNWRKPSGDLVSIMIKMADTSAGFFDGRHLSKPLADKDYEVLARAVDQVYEVFAALGVPAERTFYGTLNAGHLGGCYPLTPKEATTLHHDALPPNLYLADASLSPRSLGNPPMLTIMALAKKGGLPSRAVSAVNITHKKYPCELAGFVGVHAPDASKRHAGFAIFFRLCVVFWCQISTGEKGHLRLRR